MKFGSVPDPGIIDFTIPSDHPDTAKVLSKGNGSFEAFVGCAKWNKTDLKNFYPKGTKDELSYYSTQFNSIELNATFYNSPKKDQVLKWKEKTPEGFKFFPKLTNSISHFKRLVDTKQVVDEYCDAISGLEESLGWCFCKCTTTSNQKTLTELSNSSMNFPR